MKKYVFLLFLKDSFMQLREYTVAFGDSVVKAVLYYSMTKKCFRKDFHVCGLYFHVLRTVFVIYLC